MPIISPSSPIYPKYLHQLSPVFRSWAKLSIYDYHHALHVPPGFEGQNLYFYNNHPIQWVCLVGLVVAIEDKDDNYTITLDDGSGEVVNVIRKRYGVAGDMPVNLDRVELHGIIKVKGTINHSWGERQFMLRRIQTIKGTDAEVKCWRDTLHFKGKLLSKPWLLSEKVQRTEKRRLDMVAADSTLETELRQKRSYETEATVEVNQGYRGKRRKKVHQAVQNVQDIQAPSNRCVSPLALNPDRANLKLVTAKPTAKPTAVILPQRDPTFQSLKIVVLEHLHRNSTQAFALSHLRADPIIEGFTTLVVENNPVQDACKDTETFSASALNFSTLQSVLRVLAQDGNIICVSPTINSYIVVGRWNVEGLVDEACATVVRNLKLKGDALASASEKDSKIYARNIWLKAKARGVGWATVAKGVVTDVVTEVLSDREEWLSVGRGVWKFQADA